MPTTLTSHLKHYDLRRSYNIGSLVPTRSSPRSLLWPINWTSHQTFVSTQYSMSPSFARCASGSYLVECQYVGGISGVYLRAVVCFVLTVSFPCKPHVH